MTFGIVLVILGGFLLGGAYSVWNGGGDPEVQGRGRGGPQVAIAVVLFLAAVLASVAGVLYLI
jgi:hypothetical protein